MNSTGQLGSPGYHDPAALLAEERRVYDICAGCRRCYNLCPSFKNLLDVVDDQHDGDATALTPAEDRRVVDLCFNCNLCWPHCPYTPPHEWQLDFPSLMLRAKVQRAEAEGIGRREKTLGNPERIGRLASLAPALTNLALRTPVVRAAMEAVLGIDQRRQMPRYTRRFSSWFRRQSAPAGLGQNGRVALFSTTPVEYSGLGVGQAAVHVLWRSGIDVSLPDQVCCGMPALDGGDVPAATTKARHNIATLSRAIDEGREVVVPGPTCSRMLKVEYPRLVPGPEAEKVKAHTFDLFEYLAKVAAQGKLDRRFAGGLGKVAYHAPCHLRVQEIGFKARDVLKLVPNTTIDVIEKCSGMDGTWGFKREFYDESLKIARPLVRAVDDAAPDLLLSDCPISAVQLEQLRGQRAYHPIEALWAAYEGRRL